MVLSESFVAYHLSTKLATLANVLSLQIFCPFKIFGSKSKNYYTDIKNFEMPTGWWS